jgi:hypothetical protein
MLLDMVEFALAEGKKWEKGFLHCRGERCLTGTVEFVPRKTG